MSPVLMIFCWQTGEGCNPPLSGTHPVRSGSASYAVVALWHPLCRWSHHQVGMLRCILDDVTLVKTSIFTFVWYWRTVCLHILARRRFGSWSCKVSLLKDAVCGAVQWGRSRRAG